MPPTALLSPGGSRAFLQLPTPTCLQCCFPESCSVMCLKGVWEGDREIFLLFHKDEQPGKNLSLRHLSKDALWTVGCRFGNVEEMQFHSSKLPQSGVLGEKSHSQLITGSGNGFDVYKIWGDNQDWVEKDWNFCKAVQIIIIIILTQGYGFPQGCTHKTPHSLPRHCTMFLRRRAICDSNSAFQQEQVDVKGLLPSECLLEMT